MITIRKKIFKTELKPDEIIRRIKEKTDFTSFENAIYSKKVFTGKYDEKKDKYVLRKNYGLRKNPNRPTIHLKIFSDSSNIGTNIQVKYAFSTTFLYLYLVFIIFSSMAVVSWYIENNDLMYVFVYLLIQIILFIWMSLFGLVFFFLEYKSTKKSLEDLLNI